MRSFFLKPFFVSIKGAISIEYGLGIALFAIVVGFSFDNALGHTRVYMFCASSGCDGTSGFSKDRFGNVVDTQGKIVISVQ